ncbi:hypothetical protein PRIPAC_95864 [Pristionchus pacificus]|uniref:Cysteine synthase n=1 Tax=Pristionchus pacificus TaxID=54126 RepID=A0A2A6CU38_PRIPA|nr:hypothetical protein PRIPAC_95864 [Pristionchus pacificus]|eukprot:PDM81606.1 hypothetical protein PRIPAC_30587 [Pristionchus pacificus]
MPEMHANAAGPIGNTPLVILNRISAGLPGKIAVKLEYLNPTASVKDRAASAMIENAEKQGLITPGKTILVEATSGNMGIALASYAQIKGYKIVLLMPSTASLERRALMLAYGAEVILLDPSVKGVAMLKRAQELADSHPDFFWLNQFDNNANVEKHYNTTGPEIWRQTEGQVDIVCFGVGSGGTITGTGWFLKEKKEVQVVAVEPFESSVISGLEHSPHKIQGIGAGFVPKNLDVPIIDEIIRVTSDEALDMAKRLAKEEAIMGGISSGANVFAAVHLASKEENRGKLIVTTINSNGERYLSSVLYNDIKETAEKLPCSSIEESIATAKKLL